MTGPVVAAFLAACGLPGCSGTAGFEGPDPLTGGPPIQRRSSPAPTLASDLSPQPASTPAPAPGGQLPPVPTPSTATSQAALAGGMSQPLDSSRDLRIGAPTPMTTEQPLWRGNDTAAGPGARLNGPHTPAATLAPSGPPPAAPAANVPTAPSMILTGGGGQADTLDQALRQLRNGRRVNWERLETQENGSWYFQCAIANPAKPDAEFNYKASGATEVEAVRKVLDQIALERH
jgi:hypothetical protein